MKALEMQWRSAGGQVLRMAITPWLMVVEVKEGKEEVLLRFGAGPEVKAVGQTYDQVLANLEASMDTWRV